ncbi:P1 family peptidase [Streptomyces sp. NPDC058045]|uniref:P1 family peptidase n=1 Tax=Streptomyces sp. NPDC058045 TaxID=3346311 RepID=UPI0036E4BE8E
MTGTTVVLAPEGGVVAGVDVRGGGPGTKETDALDPRNVVERIDAVVLTGGSAYGLDAASGVMGWLEEQGRGVRVGPDRRHVVPVVPAACVFDLGRGGDFGARPGAAAGRMAVEAAAASGAGAPVPVGCVGAGTGAVVGGLKGGVGSASTVLSSGVRVAALVVANGVGSAVDPLTGVLYGDFFSGRVVYPEAPVHEAAMRRLAEARAHVPASGTSGPAADATGPASATADPTSPATDPASTKTASPSAPANPSAHGPSSGRTTPVADSVSNSQAEFAADSEVGTEGNSVLKAPNSPPLNTTLVVVATDVVLSRAQVLKLAGSAHDGIARAVRPVHLLNDGDTVFALSTGARGLPEPEVSDPLPLNAVLAAGADVVMRAAVSAVRAAESVAGPGGTFPSYGELYGVS